MMEKTDTRPAGIKPGSYTFTVKEDPVKKKNDNGTVWYEWEFTAINNEKVETYKERMFPWKMAPLLRVLGATEASPEQFEWDRHAQVGKQFDATIVMEPDRKDPNKSYPRMTEIRVVGALPF